jgi:hypothetical protein
MLTFLALFVAVPNLLTLLIFIFNVALFTHAVFREERNLMSSALGAHTLSTKSAYPPFCLMCALTCLQEGVPLTTLTSSH